MFNSLLQVIKQRHILRARARCLVAIIAAVTLNWVFLIVPSHGSGASAVSPWFNDDKPVASFLFTNKEILSQMQSALALTTEQVNDIEAVARQEAATLAQLKLESKKVIDRTDIDETEKQNSISSMNYNDQVRQTVRMSRAQVEALLTPEQKSKLPDWVTNQMNTQRLQFLEAAQAMAFGPTAATAAGGYRVYATQYYSNFGPASVDVAVPDKYVKFASLGWEYHNGYPAGGNYTVNMSYNGRQLNGVRVKDCGPWNIDDNYWNTTSGPRPRRLFGDLATGLPESQAAYFNDYNGGVDQFGRIVTNPAGIDLSPQAGVELGLGYLVSGWITVNFNWETAPAPPQPPAPSMCCAILDKYRQLGGAPGQPISNEYDVPGGRAQNFTVGQLIWNRSTGLVFWVYGAIMEKYNTTGATAGYLGHPVSDEYDVPGGRAQNFQQGRIFWSPSTGAHCVYGAILGKYLALGGPGTVGLPTTDEHDAPGGGRVSDFTSGSIYWSPTTGTFWVHGAIGARFNSLGGASALGLPLSDEYAVPGGVAANFQRGRIFWSPSTGAKIAYGAILAKYDQLGGFMGVALEDETDVTGVAGARLSEFVRGNIYWSPETGAHGVYGAILAKYKVLGDAKVVGLPLGDEADVPGRPGARVSVFEKGQIYWSPATGAQLVYGGIMNTYLLSGGPQGPLGLPISDEYEVAGQRRSDFQGGSITFDLLTGEARVYYRGKS